MSAAGLTVLRILPSRYELHLYIDRTICQPGLGLALANSIILDPKHSFYGATYEGWFMS